jgi:DNA-binding transcriptional LysR family regulator
MNNLDSDLLRTFLAVAQTGSVTAGADKIARSQSATSIQIKRLEVILGRAVFERHGRGVILSETGRQLIPIARDVTERLDGALKDISGEQVVGKIRFGIPDDHGREKLAQIIANFAQRHPQIELDVTCALSTEFPTALDKGDLDLAIYEIETLKLQDELLFEDPTVWASSIHADFSNNDVLPIALFDQACWWRDVALNALEARGQPYRIVYSSQSVSGVVAAVEAGIAIGLLGRTSLHKGLSVLGNEYNLPSTPTSKLILADKGKNDRAIEALKSVIRSTFLNYG